MSFMDVLKKMGSAIDNGLKVIDEKTAFIDKAEMFVGRGKMLDERLDEVASSANKGIKEFVPKVKEDVANATEGVKNTFDNLVNKGKAKVMPAVEKIKNKVCSAEKTAEVEPILDIPVFIDYSELDKAIPMAKIINTTHKIPQMDLKASMPEAKGISTYHQMNVFVNNAKDNTPFAEMR